MPEPVVYLNGEFLPKPDATLSVDERGVLFADGVYEVVRYFHGQPFTLEQHTDRLARSLDGIDLCFDARSLGGISDQLVARNALQEARVYWQVSRGAATRSHIIDPATAPTVYLTAEPAEPLLPDAPLPTITAITVPDDRWTNCWIKSLMLVPNTLAKTKAHTKGAGEAIFIRDGRVTEGSSTNCFAVFDGELYTHPADRYILEGITRNVVIDLARRLGIPVHEQAFSAIDLPAADACFITGTGTLLAAITAIDGNAIGDGTTNAITRRLWTAFKDEVHKQARPTA
ncbi:MAG: aminotransferase class IV [Phycisphaerales bacterium JB063]